MERGLCARQAKHGVTPLFYLWVKRSTLVSNIKEWKRPNLCFDKINKIKEWYGCYCLSVQISLINERKKKRSILGGRRSGWGSHPPWKFLKPSNTPWKEEPIQFNSYRDINLESDIILYFVKCILFSGVLFITRGLKKIKGEKNTLLC